MAYIDGEVVEAAVSADGKWRLAIIRRPDGVCRFVEDTLNDGDVYTGPYWRETHHSGLYSDPAAAKADAVAALTWLEA